MFRRRCCRAYNLKTIRYENLIRLMSENQVTLVDVRSPQEFYEGHYDGAINIPLYEIEERILDVVNDKNSIIVVYCSTGQRSRKAQSILNSMGYTEVYNMI